MMNHPLREQCQKEMIFWASLNRVPPRQNTPQNKFFFQNPTEGDPQSHWNCAKNDERPSRYPLTKEIRACVWLRSGRGSCERHKRKDRKDIVIHVVPREQLGDE